ncbi:transposase [Sulfurospirillum sp. 1307]
MSRSQYSEEFRASTMQLILNNSRSIREVSDDLGIHEKTLYSWIRAYKIKNNIPIEGRGAHFKKTNSLKESHEEELKRLRAENKILKQEREILKKAAAYFAKETL